MFSIIMPLYNKASEVGASVNSVLRQTESNFELLIIDDGSTDDSLQIVQNISDPRIRIIHQENAGVSAARNHGIQEAGHEFIAFIDADDLWRQDFLTRIRALIHKFPQAGAYTTAYTFVDGNKQRPAQIHGIQDKPMLITDYFAVAARGDLPLMSSCICIPHRVLRQVGLFPEDQKQGEDQDLWARIGLKYPIAIDPCRSMHYMQAASNRVSVESIPDQELPYSKRLQHQLDNNQIPNDKRTSVADYIAGHLLHVAQLNIRAGRPQLARSLLADRRTRMRPLRWIKWWLLSHLKSANRNTKPKVVHLLNDTDMGGIKSVVDSLSQSTLTKDFDFKFINVNPASWWRKPYNASIVMQHYACNWRTLPGMLMLKLLNPGASILIQEHHYTACFEKSVPSVARFRLMLRLNYWLANRVIAVSKGQGNWLAKAGVISKKRLRIIPQSRKLEPFFKVKAKAAAKQIILGAYGRFDSQKGFDLLLKAISKLPKSKYHLLLAGDGVQKNELQALAKGVEQVTMCGSITDVPAFLERCDLIVIPSRFEPFGLVCLEAKAAGKPVLVTDVDGLPEQAKECGLTIPAEDTQALYQALLSLPVQQLGKWGENGRKMATSAWSSYLGHWHRLLVTESKA
ncbi:MAG: glycosyltransferase [Gammaproteobacteria bacterium]|nr:glycosyltransferase [Gammaproteobacteria bacterium]